MKKFEYQRVNHHFSIGILDDLGAKGWEMVCFCDQDIPGFQGGYFVFKREITLDS